MEWQPVEEYSPPPFESVLVWDGYDVVAAVRERQRGPFWSHKDINSPEGEPMDPDPTHWMHFPSPPKAAE